MSSKQSIHIEAPVEKVFAFYKDPRKQWSTMPDQMARIGKLTDAKMTKEGVGTYSSWRIGVGAVHMDGFDVITEFVPNERMTSRSSRASVGTWTATFEPEGTGTRFSIQRQPASIWALRPIDRLVERVLGPRWRESLEKVKAELETPASSS
jgi:hypothetical protein